MTKILVTSDLHLSDKIWKHRPIEGDSYYSWQQIVQIAVEEECEAVILAGDILDKQTNLSTPVHHLLAGLQKLTAADIKIYYNQGQHEFQLSPWMALHKSSQHFDAVTVYDLGGLGWSGADFRQPDELTRFLSGHAAKSSDVLVCHQVWLEFMGEECKPQGSFFDVPENVRYLITGDYHENICKKFGNLVVLSPGSTHFRSIAEPEDKYVFVLEIDSNRKVRISTRELYTRRKIEINAVSNPDFKQVQAAIESQLALVQAYAEEVELPAALKLPLLRLTYAQQNTELANQVEKLVDNKAHLFFKQVKEKDDEKPSLSEHIDAGDRISLLSCLDNYVSKEDKPRTYQLAYKLLTSKDPEQTLYQWVKENT